MFTAVTSPPPELPTYHPAVGHQGLWRGSGRRLCAAGSHPLRDPQPQACCSRIPPRTASPEKAPQRALPERFPKLGASRPCRPRRNSSLRLHSQQGPSAPRPDQRIPAEPPAAPILQLTRRERPNALLVSMRSLDAVHSEQPLPARFASSQPMRRAFWPHVSMRPPPRDAQASPLPKRTPHPPGGRRLRRA